MPLAIMCFVPRDMIKINGPTFVSSIPVSFWAKNSGDFPIEDDLLYPKFRRIIFHEFRIERDRYEIYFPICSK